MGVIDSFLNDPEYKKRMEGNDYFQGHLRSQFEGLPQGLTEGQRTTMKARLSSGAQSGVNQGLQQLGRSVGVGSPLYAAMAGRMRAGAGANTAAQMAGVDINETQRNQDLEMSRRQQMLGLAGVMQGGEANAANTMLGAANLGLREQGMNQDEAFRRDELGFRQNSWADEFDLKNRQFTESQSQWDDQFGLQNRQFTASQSQWADQMRQWADQMHLSTMRIGAQYPYQDMRRLGTVADRAW